MNSITLAQTALVVHELRAPIFWAELDAGFARLHGTVVVHHKGQRDYRLPSIEMRVSLAPGCVTVSWLGASPVLDARSRIDLRQSADAWLDALATLMLRPAPVSARVQAASALLAAGFESVSVSASGAAPMPAEQAYEQALAA